MFGFMTNSHTLQIPMDNGHLECILEMLPSLEDLTCFYQFFLPKILPLYIPLSLFLPDPYVYQSKFILDITYS